MKAWEKLPGCRYWVIGALVIWVLWVPQALAIPELSLPDSAHMMVAFNGTQSFWDVQLYDFEPAGPSGTYSIDEGTYPGWCVDKSTGLHSKAEYTTALYSSYGSNIPSTFTFNPARGGNWNVINYIINQDQYTTALDVQFAIWWFIDGVDQATVQSKGNAWALVQAAETETSYVPEADGVVAVLLDPWRYVNGDVEHGQRSIIEAPAPVPEGSTLILFGSGLSGLLFFARKKGLLKL